MTLDATDARVRGRPRRHRQGHRRGRQAGRRAPRSTLVVRRSPARAGRDRRRRQLQVRGRGRDPRPGPVRRPGARPIRARSFIKPSRAPTRRRHGRRAAAGAGLRTRSPRSSRPRSPPAASSSRRAKPWQRLRRAAPPPRSPSNDSEVERCRAGGLVANKPGVMSTLRRPNDDGFSGVVRDTVRGRPVAEAVVLPRRSATIEREVRTADDGSFALEKLAPGEWRPRSPRPVTSPSSSPSRSRTAASCAASASIWCRCASACSSSTAAPPSRRCPSPAVGHLVAAPDRRSRAQPSARAPRWPS